MKRAPLQPFDTPVSEGPFQYVSMDLITDLLKSGKYDAILTIVNQGCSKAAKFIPINKTIRWRRHSCTIFQISVPIIWNS